MDPACLLCARTREGVANTSGFRPISKNAKRICMLGRVCNEELVQRITGGDRLSELEEVPADPHS